VSTWMRPALLSGRAALLGLGLRGRTSANGSCRLLDAGGWLDRDQPGATVGRGRRPAIAGRAAAEDPWLAARRGRARPRPRRGRGASAAARYSGRTAAGAPRRRGCRGGSWTPARGTTVLRAGRRGPLRPLGWSVCAQMLGLAGARVIKVESTTRPDGSRAGSPEFFDWMHAGHESVAIDFGTAEGRAALARLVERDARCHRGVAPARAEAARHRRGGDRGYGTPGARG